MAFDHLTVAESQMYRPQDALPLVLGIFPCLRALNMFVQYDCNSGPVVRTAIFACSPILIMITPSVILTASLPGAVRAFSPHPQLVRDPRKH
jgi:hypothetical protein